MTSIYLLGGIIAAAVFVYLLIALFFPEKF